MKEIVKLTVAQLQKELADKTLTSKEVTEAYLSQIERKDGAIGAYLTVTGDHALATAKRVGQEAEKEPLMGIPMGVKDNMLTKGILTTCASKILENFVAPYDATVVQKLSGCPILGKLNMDEFAMGSSTENSHFHITQNPRKPGYVPGGSSGGSAAAVAADEAPFALGSDTGGSIRQPAAFCGVVGMKPTYGAVSRYGLIAFSSSLDQIGPLTKDVRDSAIVLSAIAGHDKKDATSVKQAYGDYTQGIEEGVTGLKLALPKEFFAEGIDREVKDAVEKAAKEYETLGAVVEEVSMPSLKHALSAYYVISSAEASSNLARFDGVKYGFRAKDYEEIDDLYCATRSEGFGAEVKRRIMLGTFALSAGYYDAYYKKALQVRTLVMQEYGRVFQTYDAILSPVAPTTAYQIGEKCENPLSMYLGDIYTVPVNIAGLPAISLPCGEDQKGLPIGMQLVGKAFCEKTLYRIAYAYEQLEGAYHLRKGEAK